jgi:hypothetical protein
MFTSAPHVPHYKKTTAISRTHTTEIAYEGTRLNKINAGYVQAAQLP